MSKTKPKLAARDEGIALEVYDMARNGITRREICTFLGITSFTLETFYTKDFKRGEIETNMRIREFLISNATGDTLLDGATHSDCIRAASFWAKTQMGFRETQAIEHSSPDGTMATKTIDPTLVSALLKKLVD